MIDRISLQTTQANFLSTLDDYEASTRESAEARLVAADNALGASGAVEETFLARLAELEPSDDPDSEAARERAQLVETIMASATADLEVANSLALPSLALPETRILDAVPDGDFDASPGFALSDDVRATLAMPLGDDRAYVALFGFRQFDAAAPSGASPIELIGKLEKAVVGVADEIPDATAKPIDLVLDGIADLVQKFLPAIKALTLDDVLSHLPSGLDESIKRAVQFAQRFIRKVVGLIGSDVADGFLEKAEARLKEIWEAPDKTAKFLKTVVYDTETVKRQAQTIINDRKNDVDAQQLQFAIDGMEKLQARADRMMSFCEKGAKALVAISTLAFVTGHAWGIGLLAAACVLLTGFAIYYAADALDAERIEIDWLAKILGIKGILKAELS